MVGWAGPRIGPDCGATDGARGSTYAGVGVPIGGRFGAEVEPDAAGPGVKPPVSNPEAWNIPVVPALALRSSARARSTSGGITIWGCIW